MGTMTKGQMEAEISKNVVKIIREYTGRGPRDTKTYIIDDLIVVREKDVLTPIEKHLLENEGQSNGRELVKHIRELLAEKTRKVFDEVIKQITGRSVRNLYEDINTKTGGLIIVFTLDAPVEFKE